MPNHVSNHLHIIAPSIERVEIVLATLRGNQADNEEVFIDFNRITPKPPWIYDGNRLGPEHKAIWGNNNWYDWNLENWDTKWNAYDQGKWDYKFSNVEIPTISFSTAWSAPIKLMAKLPYIFPDCIFVHIWADEDYGSNTGIAVYSLDSEFSSVNQFEYEDLGCSVAGFMFGNSIEDMEYRLEVAEDEEEIAKIMKRINPIHASIMLNETLLKAVKRVPVIEVDKTKD